MVTIGSMEAKRKCYLAVDIAVLEECGSRKFGNNPNLKSITDVEWIDVIENAFEQAERIGEITPQSGASIFAPSYAT